MPAMKRALLASFALAAVAALLLASPVEAHRRVPKVDAPVAQSLPAPLPVVSPPPVVHPSPAVADPTAGAWRAAPASSTSPWVFLAAAVATAGFIARRQPRATVAAALVLLLAVLAFETGVHSVHHLGDPGRGEACAIAATSQHLSGIGVEVVVVGHAPAMRDVAPPADAPALAPCRPPSPHEDRAPPVLL
jgi:hypothetical protein